MKYSTLSKGFLMTLFLITVSCHKGIAPIFIDAPHSEVAEYVEKLKGTYDDNKGKTQISIGKDTIVFLGYHNMLPIETIYLFKRDTCVYQEINLYCSPCAEYALNNMLKDKTFDFKAYDRVNYISRKDKNVIMRVTNFAGDTSKCNSITVRRIKH